MLASWPSKYQPGAKKIDVLSRIMFPATFLGLNVVYWSYYLTRTPVVLHWAYLGWVMMDPWVKWRRTDVYGCYWLNCNSTYWHWLAIFDTAHDNEGRQNMYVNNQEKDIVFWTTCTRWTHRFFKICTPNIQFNGMQVICTLLNNDNLLAYDSYDLLPLIRYIKKYLQNYYYFHKMQCKQFSIKFYCVFDILSRAFKKSQLWIKDLSKHFHE